MPGGGADYVPRIVDPEIDELLEGLPALTIEGPKAVGKTSTASRRAQLIHRLDDPGERAVAAADPARLVRGDGLVLIDEWQRLPESWDVVRRAVDDDPSPGRFLLTGSAVPTDRPTHSGAGRIPTLRMRPLSLAERRIEEPTVSLSALLGGARPPIEGSTTVALDTYVEEILRSGFPAVRRARDRALRTQLDGYLDRIVERDFEDLGRPVRREATLRRWLAAYAAATATTTSFERMRDAATVGHRDKPARNTTSAYTDVLERLWILDPVPAWSPSRSALARLGAAPKHQLADPALAARLLAVDADALLAGGGSSPFVPRDGTLLGQLFESLVTLSVRVYAQAAEAAVAHLRTHSGDHEVELVVSRGDQSVVAIEVKLARSVGDRDGAHLRWLADRIGDRLLDSVIVTTGADAYRRADGIAVVPFALLGA